MRKASARTPRVPTATDRRSAAAWRLAISFRSSVTIVFKPCGHSALRCGAQVDQVAFSKLPASWASCQSFCKSVRALQGLVSRDASYNFGSSRPRLLSPGCAAPAVRRSSAAAPDKSMLNLNSRVGNPRNAEIGRHPRTRNRLNPKKWNAPYFHEIKDYRVRTPAPSNPYGCVS